jgi:hypothetical protein
MADLRNRIDEGRIFPSVGAQESVVIRLRKCVSEVPFKYV